MGRSTKSILRFPFEGDTPKPVVVVGGNGSGKSILLSHIVNGLLVAKERAYPEATEVEKGKVYKLRSNQYIKAGQEFYFAKTIYEGGLATSEMRISRPKNPNQATPVWASTPEIDQAWQKIPDGEVDHIDDSTHNKVKPIKELFSSNCILYFPHNRFEEPAWLNEFNLKSKAEYIKLARVSNYTDRQILNYSPLHDNQNWLFGVVYDQTAFEMQTYRIPQSVQGSDQPVYIPLFGGYAGSATNIYASTKEIIRKITGQQVRFGIGGRLNRSVSIMEQGPSSRVIVPNIFQLSSGETGLLNVFLSILRDFDLSGTLFSKTNDVRGIVVVDEIDLHLHAVHQSSVLPELMHMFPNVQFVVTTHSPLFVLGMENTFGRDGFVLYHLPSGEEITSEQFSEFNDAYHTFTKTAKFINDIQAHTESTQKRILCVEGPLDQDYIEHAASILGKGTLLEDVELQPVGGSSELDKIWSLRYQASRLMRHKVILLYDCETPKQDQNEGSLSKRRIPIQHNHPLQKGIENLFSETTIEKARQHKPAFIDIAGEQVIRERGVERIIPAKWTINPDEKTNLCEWLCANGTEEDFQHFRVVFDIIEEVVYPNQTAPMNASS